MCIELEDDIFNVIQLFARDPQTGVFIPISPDSKNIYIFLILQRKRKLGYALYTYNIPSIQNTSQIMKTWGIHTNMFPEFPRQGGT